VNPELLLETIVRSAAQAGCSDIHLRAGAPPFLRAAGQLGHIEAPALTAEQVRTCVMVSAGRELEAAAAAREYSFDHASGLRFRASAFFSGGQWSLSLRLIPAVVPTFAELRLPPVMKQLTAARPGLVLITGPTGAGKSTTAAALLQAMVQAQALHIVSVEDPIEYRIASPSSCVTQREIGRDVVTVRAGLMEALRMDPDVLFVGELRDDEAFEVALHAAETGICVISTFHTQSAAHTIGRATSLGRPDQAPLLRERFADALRATISQRLLPRRGSAHARVLATEVMINNYATKEAIRDPSRHKAIPSILERSGDQGMHTFDQSLSGLVAAGVVDVEVAAAVAQSPTNFRRSLQVQGIREQMA
jgi:twitching motility protein PilT